MEHEYEVPDFERARDDVEIAEMFVRLCYPFFVSTTVGAFVGLDADSIDWAWESNLDKSEIRIYDAQGGERVTTPSGFAFINHSPLDQSEWALRRTIPIMQKNRLEWIDIMNALVYATKRSHVPFVEPNCVPEEWGRIVRSKGSESIEWCVDERRFVRAAE
jgi:hypothetical protein